MPLLQLYADSAFVIGSDFKAFTLSADTHIMIQKFLVFSFLMGFLLALSPSALALQINAVRIGAHPEKTRLVLEMDQTADFRSFILQSPDRLVIDLPDFNWQAGSFTAQGMFNNLRTGQLQAGIMRIVLDLNNPAKILSAFLLPKNGIAPDRLVIDIKAASLSEAAAVKDRIMGTLDTAKPQFNLSSERTAGTNINAMPTPSRKPASGSKPLIMIDAGHGGQDPGAVNGGRLEKHVTLATARELKRQLESSGAYRVQLTRDTDKFIKLAERVNIAHRAGADLFISLHADSIDKPGVRGASIYTLSNTASDAQTARLAARENKADLIGGVDLNHEDKDVANILIDLAMRDTMNQSKFFANTMVTYMASSGIKMLPRPHRYAGFAVLKAPDIPSVLIELGFMSNRAEADALLSAGYQKKLASALKSGIDAYFQHVQKNNKSE